MIAKTALPSVAAALAILLSKCPRSLFVSVEFMIVELLLSSPLEIVIPHAEFFRALCKQIKQIPYLKLKELWEGVEERLDCVLKQ